MALTVFNICLLKSQWIALWAGFPGSSASKESTCNAGDQGLIPGWGRPLEKEMATHSGIFAWEVQWTEEPGGYSPWGCKELDKLSDSLFHFHDYYKCIFYRQHIVRSFLKFNHLCLLIG